MLCAFLTSTLDGVSGQLYDPVILSLVPTELEIELAPEMVSVFWRKVS